MDHELENEKEMRSMMKDSHRDILLDKSVELNDTMTINESSRDEYEKTLHNIDGGNQ